MSYQLSTPDFSPDGATRVRLAPNSLLVPLANVGLGFVNAQTRIKPIRLNRSQDDFVHIDAWLLWQHLGDFAKVRFSQGEDTFKIPDPQDVILLLEQSHTQWLNAHRATLEQAAAWVGGAATAEQKLDGLRKCAPGYVFIIDLMLLYVRHNWSIFPTVKTGWEAGLAQEMKLLAQKLPSQSDWHPESKRVWDTFVVPVEQMASVSLPRFDVPQETLRRDGSRVRELSDPSRLEFYLQFPSYREIRDLRRNRYNYVAVVFEGNRVIVDTAQKENRLFLWRGPLDEVLEQILEALSSTAIKTQMSSKSLCISSHEHDEAGMEAVRRFLA